MDDLSTGHEIKNFWKAPLEGGLAIGSTYVQWKWKFVMLYVSVSFSASATLASAFRKISERVRTDHSGI